MNITTSHAISVIIPALNEQASMGPAIDAAWEAGAKEVIVADGGSCDDTPHIATRKASHLVRSNPGRGTQQNAGAAIATQPILLFQHADCRLSPGALGPLSHLLAQRPHVVAGAFRQQIEPSRAVYQLVAWGNAVRVRWFGLAYGDQGIFVRREAFDQIGGFADVPLMEDVILMRRLRRLGRTVLLPGPLHVSARRWQQHGLIRQTIRNWCLLTAFFCGVSPTTLRRFYPRHDETTSEQRATRSWYVRN